MNKKQEEFSELDFDLSYLVTAARLWSGLTQDQLAKKVGTKQPAIARLESGSLVPSWKILKKIASVIGTDIVSPRFSFMDKGFSNGKKFLESKVLTIRQSNNEDEHGCSKSLYRASKQEEKFSVSKSVEFSC